MNAIDHALLAFRPGLALMTLFGAAGIVAIAGPAQVAVERGTIEGSPVITVSNDKLSLTLRAVGGAMVRLLMKDDLGQLNPFEGLGHFVCVDGFGPVSKEEEAAGLPGHGEAHRVPWDLVSSAREGDTFTVQFSAALPLVHEN